MEQPVLTRRGNDWEFLMRDLDPPPPFAHASDMGMPRVSLSTFHISVKAVPFALRLIQILAGCRKRGL